MSDRPIDDGGPAYPGDAQSALSHDHHEGMSLRDHFAEHAPPPPAWWMNSYAEHLDSLDKYGQHVAQWAYVYADAMIAERKKANG